MAANAIWVQGIPGRPAATAGVVTATVLITGWPKRSSAGPDNLPDHDCRLDGDASLCSAVGTAVISWCSVESGCATSDAEVPTACASAASWPASPLGLVVCAGHSHRKRRLVGGRCGLGLNRGLLSLSGGGGHPGPIGAAAAAIDTEDGPCQGPLVNPEITG